MSIWNWCENNFPSILLLKFLVKFASQFSLFAGSIRLKLTSHFHFHFEAVWDRMEVINCKNGYESMRQFWYYGCFVSYVWHRTVSNTIVILSTIIPIIKINYCSVFLRFFSRHCILIYYDVRNINLRLRRN